MKANNRKLVHGQVRSLREIRPAPENEEIYREITIDNTRNLIATIHARGLLEPILISSDGVVISGHRRFFVARVLRLENVPVKVHPVSYEKDREEFLKLLVEANAQRIKGADMLLAEAAVKIDPVAAHAQLKAERLAKEKSRREDCTLSEVTSDDDGQRCQLSAAKQPMIDAIRRIIREHYEHWPLTVRQIHYRLLGPQAPLRHASKPGSRYVNDRDSYRAAIDVCSRGRLAGLIPWDAIDDETRIIDVNDAFPNLGEFFRYETGNFLHGYWRNLLQSQPHHIEIVTEKRTLHQILAQVARDHTMPLAIMGGMSTLTPKKKIIDHYRRSRKDKLIVLAISDFDPAGEAIAEDLLKSFRRDFGIRNIEVYKVALTMEQVEEFGLTRSMEAKEKSPTFDAYVEKYGTTDAWELEALAPADLVDVLTRSIEEVIDVDLFNQEARAEEADAAQLVAIQRRCAEFFRSLKLSK